MDELHVHTIARVHKFSKIPHAISKTRCQKRDIKEVHKLQFRHCLGVIANMI